MVPYSETKLGVHFSMVGHDCSFDTKAINERNMDAYEG